MDLKNKIRKELIESYGQTFDSYLEIEYEKKITDKLINGDLKIKHEWITYNQVILELKHSIKDLLKVKELQYRLTDNTLPNKSCIEVLDSVKNMTPELVRLYNKIKNF